MAKRYHSEEILLQGSAQTVGASTTAAVSKPIQASMQDALNGVVECNVSAVTNSSGAILLTLQDSHDGETWNTVKSTAAVTSTGLKTIRWNVQNTTDQGYLPLRPHIRVVATTGASDSITVDSVRISSAG